jgi:hypothetical protein
LASRARIIPAFLMHVANPSSSDPISGLEHVHKQNTMSWKSTKEKERFFEQLDRAFNTPSTETLVIPKFNEGPRASSEVKRRVSEPVVPSTTKKRRTSPSDRVSSTGVGARPKPPKRPSPTRRTSGIKPEEPKKSDLLDGMVLFFIPNSKKNGVRRFRMTLFAQHGAIVRDSWGDDITHVICDEKITGERVMRDLQMEQFPVSFQSWDGILMVAGSHNCE